MNTAARLPIIEVAAVDHSRFSSELEARLLEALATINEQSENETITLSVRGDNGQLLAGLVGYTSYGWLHVHLLWVEESLRETGLGSRLLRASEQKARELKCHGAWLETSNSNAYEFYRKHRYEEFGKLSNEDHQSSPAHLRYFLRKEL